MSKDNGGPAFKVMFDARTGKQIEGISVRDYIAVRATEEDIKNYMPSHSGLQGKAITGRLAKTREEAKYMYADAMLEERSK